MIGRWILHVEAHRGRWPRVRLRRAPRAGDIVWEGPVPCQLERCTECGDGFLARELTFPVDPPPEPEKPQDEVQGWPHNRTAGQLGLCGPGTPGADTRSGDPLAGLPVAQPWTPRDRDEIATAADRAATWAVRGRR